MATTLEATPDGPDAPEGPQIDALAIANLPFAEELYFQFLADPDSVDPTWRRLFERLDGAGPNGNGAAHGNGGGNGATAATYVPPAGFPRGVFAANASAFSPSPPGVIQSRTSVRLLSERVQRLVEAYRELGHLSADLDPLGLVKRNDGAARDLEDFGLAEEDLDQVFSSENVAGPDRTTLARSHRPPARDLLPQHRRRAGPPARRRAAVAGCRTAWRPTRNRIDADAARPDAALLEKVMDAEVFEQFLQNKFLGNKRFSLEGGESLIPLLRSPDRARGAVGRRRDRHRHGPPRAPERAGQRDAEAGPRRSSPSSRTGRDAASRRRAERRRREVPPRLLHRPVPRRRSRTSTGCTCRWPSTPATWSA